MSKKFTYTLSGIARRVLRANHMGMIETPWESAWGGQVHPDIIIRMARGTPLNSLEDRFMDFHTDNPHVADLIDDLAFQAMAAGCERFAMGAIFGRLRYEFAVQTIIGDDDEFALQQNFTPYYARWFNSRHETNFITLKSVRGEDWGRAWSAYQLAGGDDALAALERPSVAARHRLGTAASSAPPLDHNALNPDPLDYALFRERTNPGRGDRRTVCGHIDTPCR